MLKNPLEALFEAVNVVVDEVLLVDLGLVDQADEREALVHLSQIEHDVLGGVRVPQSDEGARLLVELAAAAVLVNAVDAGHVNEHVDQFGADLVVLHVHGRRIGGYVDFADYIEQEGLLDVGPGDEGVHHRGDEGHLGQQFLDDLRKSLVDRVVVDRGQVVGNLSVALVVLQHALHGRLDLEEAVRLLVVSHEHVGVHLVNEHFVVEVRLHFTRLLD